MESNRCKMAVKEELKRLGLHFVIVGIGEIEVMENISERQRQLIKTALLNSGFDLMDDESGKLVEKTRTLIIDLVHNTDKLIKIDFPVLLSEKLNHDYSYLENIFSELLGSTIEQFIICHKIERIKEMILYDELNISEIAWKMNYSSAAHLSNQFKKTTGLSPSHFKLMKGKKQNPIEEI